MPCTAIGPRALVYLGAYAYWACVETGRVPNSTYAFTNSLPSIIVGDLWNRSFAVYHKLHKSLISLISFSPNFNFVYWLTFFQK